MEQKPVLKVQHLRSYDRVTLEDNILPKFSEILWW